RWIVPVDDTNTMFIEFRHVSETEGVTPAWWADRDIMLPGQLAAESYEESQRHPGDYEAQVSQRPIAIHGLEHLGATDRGVSMFRNQIRRGIRAVKAGDEPPGLRHVTGAVTPTYCNDTIVQVPPAAHPSGPNRRLVGRLNPLILGVTNAWSPVLLRAKFWIWSESGVSGSWLKLISFTSWPITGAGSVAFSGENPKSPSRLYSTAPGLTGPVTKTSGTKSIPVNDESAPSIARGEVIGCGGNANTS